MKAWIGLGSNLGNRLENLERAARAVIESSKKFQISPVVETPALVPPGADATWDKPYLNAVVSIDWDGNPLELLAGLKSIERELGRAPAPRWAPRVIDLDVLALGDRRLHGESLTLPHPEITRRQFVLTPLKHLSPNLMLPGQTQSVLQLSRARREQIPLWMGIFNLTPDSFSDGAVGFDFARAQSQTEAGVQILDLGAESTRPGATPLTVEQEWERLQPVLELQERKRLFRPWISVDTYHSETAQRALDLGVDIINDVSGLGDPGMLEVLQNSGCQYVLMHSLSVPADPSKHLESAAPVLELREWCLAKLEKLQKHGISLDRVIFDPGLGFGKTMAQSWSIVKNIDRFLDLPVRILVGHSRKSMFKKLHVDPPADRDPETTGVSIQLARAGVDILRVHDPIPQARAFRSFMEAQL